MSFRVLLLLGRLCLEAQQPVAPLAQRPGLFLREDWKESDPVTPITQEHVANPDVVLGLYGPGKEGIRKSHHDKPSDDPYYVWTGACPSNCAVTVRRRASMVNLTGPAKIRWRSKQSGLRQLHVILKLANGTWLVSEQSDGPSFDWRVSEFNLQDLVWRRLDIRTVVEGDRVERPDLSRVDEIGWTDLMVGGNSPASSRVDWIEVYGAAAR